MRILTVGFALLMVLGGCTTTPDIRYYTLDMSSASGGGGEVRFEIGRVRLSEPVASKDIFIQISPTEVEYYASDQWVAGVDELVADKLRAEFGPGRPDAEVIDLDVAVKKFGQRDVGGGGVEAHVRLEARMERRGGEVLEKVYSRETPVGPSTRVVNGVVVALSRSLEEIAAEMAADAAAL